MRRYLIPLVLAIDLALAFALAWQWVTPQGQLRDVRWTPPTPIKPVLTDNALPTWSADLGSFIGSLDRPLFSATRKPPAKPEAVAAAAADTLGDVRVLGLYSFGDSGGGAIVRAQGKIQRVRQGDALGGWTVKQVRPLELVLARGAESRTLDVKRGPDLGPDTPAGAGGPTGPQNSGLVTPQQREQQAKQDADNSRAAVNALRARSGMPLLP
jgi:hypothetical protein